MRIIGKDDSKERTATCPKCATIIGYLPIEVQSKSYLDISQAMCTYYWINCPNCGNKIEVSRPKG